MKDIKRQFGPWIIVTGASLGIGKEFARQLANEGINLILVARKEELLKSVSAQLAAQYGIQVKYLKADLRALPFLGEAIINI